MIGPTNAPVTTHLLLLPLFLLVAIPGCVEDAATAPLKSATSSPQVPRQVSVAAASDLKFALDELIADFAQRQPDIDIRVTYGSSGNFYSQLCSQAPFDIYFSADRNYPQRLIEQGLADKDSEFLYGAGEIVVWVPHHSELDVEQLGIQTLLAPSVRKIAIANPQHAPYGRAAEAALRSLEVYEKVQSRLVLGENIAQTAQFVESGAADVGIIALSLALAPAMRTQGRYWRVPLEAYPTLEQGGVILNWARDRTATEQFRAFIAGAHGRATLQRYGFRRPGE